VREEVLISIYHEIAHIVYGTFELPSNEDKLDALNHALGSTAGRYSKAIAASFENLPEHKKNSYMALSNLISPFMPILVNSLEDARVDESMFKARKGTRVMFDALIQGVFASGIEQDDGTRTEWKDQPLNNQVLLGVFVLAAGYKYEGWFHSEVEKALADEKLCELVDRMEEARSSRATYALAFPILARLRELGFCKHPDDPEEEEEESGEEESDEQNADESGDSVGTDRTDIPEQSTDDSPEADDGITEDDDGDPGEADETSGDEGEDSEEASGSDSSSDDGTLDDSSEPESEDSGDSDDVREGESESDDGGAPDETAEPDSGGTGSDGDEGDSSDQGAGDSTDEGNPAAETGTSAGSGGGSGNGESSEGGADDDGDLHREAEEGDLAGNERREPLDEGSSSGENEQEDSTQPGGDREVPSSLGGDPDPEGEATDPSTGSDSDHDEVEDSSPVDSGVDEGKGGQETEQLYFGGPEGVIEDIQVFGQHDGFHADSTPEGQADDKAVEIAIIQGLYFEKPSANVQGVREHIFGTPFIQDGQSMSTAWAVHYSGINDSSLYQRLGIDADTEVGEEILGPALLEMRRAFEDNARADMQRHLRSGKVNARVLGKRAWAGDDRLFQKKRMPGKKSYAVVLGIDISGSTVGVNIALAKRAAMAQAELCHRAGIDFAVYAHTARGSARYYGNDLWLDMYEIKAFDKPWNETAQQALAKISSDAENLDGHGIEYYRKLVEQQSATDKIILYYSDGKMPAANHAEELEILQREIAYCKQKNITLLGVGIRTDSPRRHGLDTVQVDEDSDMVKVIRHLQGALLHRR
jgi:hypothetical protein